MSDRLHDTLATLRTDVDRTPLADSSAVRARGTQRTRRQAVGISLAVVALVAGAVGIGGALTGTNKADTQLPADHTTTAPTAEDMRGEIVLLSPAELPTFPNQPFSIGETLDPATTADTQERFLTMCGTPPSGGRAPASAVLRVFTTELDVSMWQWVALYPSPAEARSAVAALSAACTDKGAIPVDVGTSEMPDAIRAGQFSADPGSDYHGEVVGVVRMGPVVTVLGLRGMLKESDVDFAAFDASLSNAAGRLSAR